MLTWTDSTAYRADCFYYTIYMLLAWTMDIYLTKDDLRETLIVVPVVVVILILDILNCVWRIVVVLVSCILSYQPLDIFGSVYMQGFNASILFCLSCTHGTTTGYRMIATRHKLSHDDGRHSLDTGIYI